MKNLALLLIGLGFGLLANAQAGTEFEIESFNAIQVSHAFEVYLQQDKEHAVTAVVPSEMMEFVQIEVIGGTLEVSLKDGHKKNKWWNGRDENIVVHISFPSIHSIDISGAVELDARHVLELDDLAIDASGASEIHLHVKCDDLAVDLSGASELSMDVYADNFTLEASGASAIELTGHTDDFSIDCSGASNINAIGLEAEDLKIDCSGASSIRAWADDEITITASGSSDIRYKCDNCQEAHVNTTGGSSVKKY